MKRIFAITFGLLAACGGAAPVMVEPDPLPEGSVQLFSRSSFDIDRGLRLATNGDQVVALFTEQDQDGHRLVFARYLGVGPELSRDVLELSGASGAAPVDLQFTGDGYIGLFVRLTEDARTFIMRYAENGTRVGGVVPLNEMPLYEPGPVRGEPRGFPRLGLVDDRLVLVWPAGVGSQVVLHAGFIDEETGEVSGQRLMDTLPDAYPAPSRVVREGNRLWFAWLEQPASGLNRLRTTALDTETLAPRVSGAIIAREVVGAPAVAAGRIIWSGVPFTGGEAGLHLTTTSSGAAEGTERIGESAEIYALASDARHASVFTVRGENRLAQAVLDGTSGGAGAGASWVRKSSVLDLEATRTSSMTAVYWEEMRSDRVRVGVLRFFEESP